MCAVLVTIMSQAKCPIELKSAYAINHLWGIDCILLSDDTNILPPFTMYFIVITLFEY